MIVYYNTYRRTLQNPVSVTNRARVFCLVFFGEKHPSHVAHLARVKEQSSSKNLQDDAEGRPSSRGSGVLLSASVFRIGVSRSAHWFFAFCCATSINKSYKVPAMSILTTGDLETIEKIWPSPVDHLSTNGAHAIHEGERCAFKAFVGNSEK